MPSGRISHVLIADVNIHLLLPVFQKPQIPLQLWLPQSCLLEGWCLCGCLILVPLWLFDFAFLPAHLTMVLLWGDGCRNPLYRGLSAVLGCAACTIPKDIPSFHDPSTLSFSPSQSPGSTQNTQSSPDCAGLYCFCSWIGRVLSVPCTCCQLLHQYL